MAFPDRFLDELTDRSDIAELVSRYVLLTPRGGRLFGLCPFHGEKTASFSVLPERQMFYCFGCGAGGGPIQFVMRMENLDFSEAVRLLADRAGMAVPEDEGDRAAARMRERVYALNQKAARFFHDALSDPGGAPARDYLVRRGLSPGTITRFGLGWAPDSWDALMNAMVAEGFTKDELLSAGLVVKNKTGGLYDRFRRRLIFPIIDLRRQVVGFGGRVLDDSLPKYLNSPDTPVFSKSRQLFALNLAKNNKDGPMILCEGYMDVISLHQAGFSGAVASLGTAFTEQQALLVKRYAKEVVLSYDGDRAGQAAAARAISILSPLELPVRVLRMKDAKDPDEYIRRFGRDAFSVLLSGSESQMEFRLLNLKAKFDLETDEGRLDFCREGILLLCGLPSAAARNIYAAKLSEMSGISQDAILADLRHELSRQDKKDKRRFEKKALTPDATVQPAARGLRYDDLRSALAEEDILQILFSSPELIAATEKTLSPADFSAPLLGQVYAFVLERNANNLTPTLSALEETLSPDELSHITRILQKPRSPASGRQALSDCVAVILSQRVSRFPAEDGEDPLLRKQKMYKESRGYGGKV